VAATEVGVLIVDDQPFFRGAARDVLRAAPGFRALAEAASGVDAIAFVRALRPDLVLLDVRMPGMDGIEAARAITGEHPGTVVVLISIDEPDAIPAAARSCGAAAVVRKQDLRPALLEGLWAEHGPRH
jgi:DNA-binding NarL/FixJ family response regulator